MLHGLWTRLWTVPHSENEFKEAILVEVDGCRSQEIDEVLQIILLESVLEACDDDDYVEVKAQFVDSLDELDEYGRRELLGRWLVFILSVPPLLRSHLAKQSSKLIIARYFEIVRQKGYGPEDLADDVLDYVVRVAGAWILEQAVVHACTFVLGPHLDVRLQEGLDDDAQLIVGLPCEQ